MEAVGHEKDRFYGTVHLEAFNGMIGNQKGGVISKSKDDWHVFEVDWQEDVIKFAIDSQVYFEYPTQGDGSSKYWPYDQEVCKTL